MGDAARRLRLRGLFGGAARTSGAASTCRSATGLGCTRSQHLSKRDRAWLHAQPAPVEARPGLAARAASTCRSATGLGCTRSQHLSKRDRAWLHAQPAPVKARPGLAACAASTCQSATGLGCTRRQHPSTRDRPWLHPPTADPPARSSQTARCAACRQPQTRPACTRSPASLRPDRSCRCQARRPIGPELDKMPRCAKMAAFFSILARRLHARSFD